MNINRHNAEAFFLDYYEGKLSDVQIAEMFAFLKANPDLREAFESFSDVSVNDEKIAAPDFSFLKKPAVKDEHERAEQWMVDHVDGVITVQDREALDRYLAEFPAKRKELERLEKTILRADAGETFGDVSSLKKAVAVTAENFDDYAFALAEGTISSPEKKALDEFISTHPEFRGQLEAWRSAVLETDAVHFEGKELLKKVPLVVTTENIEELLVAKSEGELAAHEAAAVNDFIARFPEYRTELEELARVRLKADTSIVFENKEALKRGVVIINETNVEHYLLSATEGLLNGEELKALHAFVASHPKYNKSMAAYAATHVQADPGIVYGDKEKLKRRAGGAWWHINVRYAAAAVLILLLGVYFWMKSGSNTSDSIEVPVAYQEENKSNSNGSNGESIPENTVPPADHTNDELAVVESPEKNNTVTRIISKQEPVAEQKQVREVTHVENAFVPVRILAARLDNKANDAVHYSDALYDAVFSEEPPLAQQESDDRYITPAQLAMRWMKNKLDGPEATLASNDPDNDRRFPENPDRDKNVDGMDLTTSAVNRVGDAATGGNISMDQREDGTYLHLWNYSVRVSSAK